MKDVAIFSDELTIAGQVATGGFSTVYLAHRREQAETANVAIKCVANDKAPNTWLFSMQSLLFEGNVMRALKHRNIIAVHGLCVLPASSFKGIKSPMAQHGATALVMEYGKGSLSSKIYKHQISAGRSTYKWSDALDWALDIAAAVAYLHGRPNPIIHRDLKIENVLLCYDAELDREVAKLCDFGLSAYIQADTACVNVASRMALTTECSIPRTAMGLQRLIDSDEAMVKDPLTPLLSDASAAPAPPEESPARANTGSLLSGKHKAEPPGFEIAYALPRSRNASMRGLPLSVTEALSAEILVDLRTSKDAMAMLEDCCVVVKPPTQDKPALATPRQHDGAPKGAAQPVAASRGASPDHTRHKVHPELGRPATAPLLLNRHMAHSQLARIFDVSERPTEVTAADGRDSDSVQSPVFMTTPHGACATVPLLDSSAEASCCSPSFGVPSMLFANPAEERLADECSTRRADAGGEVEGDLHKRANKQPCTSDASGRSHVISALPVSIQGSPQPNSSRRNVRASSPEHVTTAATSLAAVTTRCAAQADAVPPSSVAAKAGTQGMLDVFKQINSAADHSQQNHYKPDNAAPPCRLGSQHSRLGSQYSGLSRIPSASKVSQTLGNLLPKKRRPKVTERVKWQMTGGTGSMAYMAPEVLQAHAYNAKIDVFSLSVVLWEIFSKTQITNKFDTEQALLAWTRAVMKGERMPFPSFFPAGLRKLIAAGWTHHPDDRPTAAAFLEQLVAWSKTEECREFTARDRKSSGLFGCFGCCA